MIYLILEIAKLTAWVIILCLALAHRKEISVNILWLSIISAVLMVLGSVDDILNTDVLMQKSYWWLVGNVFIIINYFVVLRRSWKFFGAHKKKLSDFLELMQEDIKEYADDK